MNHTRHIGIFNAQDWPVTLIGAGGIGAITAIVLAKMGVPELQVWDGDEVDEVNIATQFHLWRDIGRKKVAALSDSVELFSDETSFDLMPFELEADTDVGEFANPILISAVDSIKARKAIWEAVKRSHFIFYLDARMGAEVFSLYAVDGQDYEWYDQMIQSEDDSQIPDDPCTSKATIYCGALAAAHIGSTVRKIITGLPVPRLLSQDMLSGTLMEI